MAVIEQPTRPLVLLVEDYEDTREMYREYLEFSGFAVVTAADGIEAIEKARSVRPDVVLMDLAMPGVDGLDATRQILSRRGETAKVLVLTTFDEDDKVFTALSSGASGFLLKDVEPDDLVHAVRVVARGEAMLGASVTRRLIDRYEWA